MLTCAEYGLNFANEGDHWRCVEHPDLVMVPGERYQVGESTIGSLNEALRHLEATGPAQHQ